MDIPTATLYVCTPSNSSGARKKREQMYDTFVTPGSMIFMLPRSPILRSPVASLTRMLCGLMSRCAMLNECRYDRPQIVW